MRVIEYRLARAVSSEFLAGSVNELISQGWEPYGPVLISEEPSHTGAALRWLCQPMVKRDYTKAGDQP